MSAPSDGGEEAIAPRVPPVPSKPTEAEQDEHHATGHAAYRSWCEHCVRGRGRVSQHVPHGTGRIPSDDLVCKCKAHWVPGSEQVLEKGMNAYAPAFFADGCAVWDGNGCC